MALQQAPAAISEAVDLAVFRTTLDQCCRIANPRREPCACARPSFIGNRVYSSNALVLAIKIAAETLIPERSISGRKST